MRNECNIIRDILPLYIEDMVSVDTASFVDEHLNHCSECSKELENMRTSNSLEKVNTSALSSDEDTKAIKAVASAWKKSKKASFVKGLLIATAALVLIIALFNTAFSFERMEGASMSTTINDDDLCLFSKVTYLFNSPARGDIALVDVAIGNLTISDIARIIAIPGDTVSIKNGTLYVNNDVCPYFEENVVVAYDMENKITLEENEYFVMGDNQSVAVDSRSQSYGLVSKEAIRQKLLLVF